MWELPALLDREEDEDPGAEDEEDETMTLTKIKARKGKPVTIHWTELTPTGQTEEHTLSCEDPGSPELYEALNALQAFVVDLCELPPSYDESMDIIGVTILEGEERQIVVTALKSLSGCQSPLVLNTPLAPPFNHAYALEQIQEQALRYVNGIRAQLEIDFSKKGQKQESEEVPA